MKTTFKFGDRVWHNRTGKATIVRYGAEGSVLEDDEGRLTSVDNKDLTMLGIEDQIPYDMQILVRDGVPTLVIDGAIKYGITDIMFTYSRGNIPKLTITKLLYPEDDINEDE
jgi:hypothetical protein